LTIRLAEKSSHVFYQGFELIELDRMDCLFVPAEEQLTRPQMGQDLQDTFIIDNPVFARKDQEDGQLDLADAPCDRPVQGAARQEEPSGDAP
jgi:hypothetical protein